MKKLSSITAVLTTVAIMAMPAFASAINYGGVGGQPANPQPNNPRTQSIFIYQLKPGQQVSDGVRVQNNTGQTQTVALDAVDSELASGGSFTCKQSVEPKKDVGAWIQFQSSSVTLAPNSTQVVPFTLTVPTSGNIDVGEHDGCITLQAASQTATKSSSSGILLSFRSAIRVVVTIPGKIVKQLSILNVKVTQTADGKYQVTPTVSNDGNVSLDTTLKVKLVSALGGVAQTLNAGTSPVLPHSKASWNYTLNRPFWGGFYHAQVVATYNANPASELGVNSNGQPVTKTLDSSLFFSAPKPAAAVIELLILLAVIAVVAWLVRYYRRQSQIRSTWTDYEVKANDTLQKLSSKRQASWKEVARANKLKPPYHLEKGQTLILPPKSKE